LLKIHKTHLPMGAMVMGRLLLQGQATLPPIPMDMDSHPVQYATNTLENHPEMLSLHHQKLAAARRRDELETDFTKAVQPGLANQKGFLEEYHLIMFYL